MTTFLVKTENGNDTVYFEVKYTCDHYNNYVNNTIRDHALTQKFMNEGYDFPTIFTSYEISYEADLEKAKRQVANTEKHKKKFPTQYYDALKKTTQLTEALLIITTNMFVTE